MGYIQEEPRKEQPKSMKDLMKGYNLKKKEGRAIHNWQQWALSFQKKYSIPKEDLPVLMRYAKLYKDNHSYLMFVEGWIDDYPNLDTRNVLKLFLWKIKDDRRKREKQSYI